MNVLLDTPILPLSRMLKPAVILGMVRVSLAPSVVIYVLFWESWQAWHCSYRKKVSNDLLWRHISVNAYVQISLDLKCPYMIIRITFVAFISLVSGKNPNGYTRFYSLWIIRSYDGHCRGLAWVSRELLFMIFNSFENDVAQGTYNFFSVENYTRHGIAGAIVVVVVSW